MAKQGAPGVESLFQELDNFIQENEYAQAIKVCDKILSQQPDDQDAFTCKVICLVRGSQFDAATSFMDTNKALAQGLVFERAYCHYRNKRLDEGLALLRTVPKPKPARVMELEAQLLYRKEEYAQAAAVYEDLIRQHKVQSPELSANLLAAYSEAHMTKEGEGLVARSKDAMRESFELAFNAACIAIASGHFEEAESYLQLAEKVCTEALKEEEDYDADEVHDELAPVLVQLGYCCQMLGKHAPAMELYAKALKNKQADLAAGAVAANNVVVIKRSHELFDSYKKLKSATTEAVEQKLSSTQRRVINFNKCLVYLHMNKPEDLRKQIELLREPQGDGEAVTLVLAAQLVREKKAEEAEALLAQFSKGKGKGGLRTQLSLAQMHLSRNEHSAALAALQGVAPEHSHRPGMVATLAALQQHAGDSEGAFRTLRENIEWHEKQGGGDEQYATLVKAHGTLLMQAGKHEEAARMYERLVRKDKNDLIALTSLIIATSHFNPDMAEKLLGARLPPLAGVDKVDAEALENLAPLRTIRPKEEAPVEAAAPAPASQQDKSKAKGKGKEMEKGKGKESQQAPSTGKPTPSSSSSAATAEKKKRKRKPRLPKSYDPKVPPDPQRWLPKYERTNYKLTRKDKEKAKKKAAQAEQLGKGSQGSSAQMQPVATARPQPAGRMVQEVKDVRPLNHGKKKKGKK